MSYLNHYKETKGTFVESTNKQKQLDDSSLNQCNIKELIPLQEFIQLSNEIKVAAQRRECLLNSLYTPSYVQKQFKFKREEELQVTPYQQLYMSWKNQQTSDCTFDSTYKSTLALLDKQKRHQQFKRLINQSKIPEPIYKYQDQNPYLKTTSYLHQERLSRTLNGEIGSKTEKNKFTKDQIKQQTNARPNVDNTQKSIEIAVQKQLLKRISEVNKKQQLEKQRLQKQQQMEKKCYVDFIQKPIFIKEKQEKSEVKIQKQPFFNDYTVQIKTTAERHQSTPKKIEKKPAYRLNIQQMLKIKPKQYLIFYSDNYHQILRLASPQQMKQLNHYRDQCLKKEEALSKLKEKVAQYGPQYIKKLHPSSRYKLFQLLYQEDLQIQKNYNQ